MRVREGVGPAPAATIHMPLHAIEPAGQGLNTTGLIIVVRLAAVVVSERKDKTWRMANLGLAQLAQAVAKYRDRGRDGFESGILIDCGEAVTTCEDRPLHVIGIHQMESHRPSIHPVSQTSPSCFGLLSSRCIL